MLPLYLALAGVSGLLIGSFLNVCIYRVPRDLSVAAPRSFCPGCEKTIAWYDNIPLLSYFVLQGRCRHCAHPIGLRYPFVELTTAIAFIAVTAKYGLTPAALKWAFFDACLIVLFWTDLEERLLPDEFTLGGVAVGLFFLFFVNLPGAAGQLLLPRSSGHWQSLLNAAAGAALLIFPVWLLAFALSKLRHRDFLGLGDLKLLLLMGIFLGAEDGLLALMAGAVLGSVIGLIYIAATRKDASTYELPFGSFLCLGALLTPLLHLRPYSILDVL